MVPSQESSVRVAIVAVPCLPCRFDGLDGWLREVIAHLDTVDLGWDIPLVLPVQVEATALPHSTYCCIVEATKVVSMVDTIM